MAIQPNFPSVKPSLNLDFANTKQLDPRITFTRASSASYFDRDGFLKLAASGVPRFDHDPTTGESLGLLIEEQGTNLLTYSEDFADAAWNKNGATVTANAEVAPDGTLTGDKLVENTETGTHNTYVQISGLSTSTQYTYSVYVKSAERSSIQLALRNSSFGYLAGAVFNLTTQVITNTNGSPATSITNVGNGWYRLTIVATSIDTTVGPLMVLLSTGTTTNYTGNGTSGLYIWGAQLEAGAFPTSYIPSSSAATTRAADVAVMNGSNFSSWYRQDEGTFVWSALAVNASGPAAGGTVAVASNGTNSMFISMGRGHADATNRFEADIVASSTGQMYVNSDEWTAGTLAKIALAYKLNDCAFVQNGQPAITDTSVTVPTVNRLFIGVNMWGTSGWFNGHISRIAYYPRRLSDAELQAITS